MSTFDRKILGAVGRERGECNEAKVEAAMKELESFPEWLQAFRPGTPDEDRQGIDFVAETDVGKVPLQVKSSELGKKRFEEKHPRGHIPVVIVKAAERLSDLAKKVIDTLKPVYDKYKKLRPSNDEQAHLGLQ